MNNIYNKANVTQTILQTKPVMPLVIENIHNSTQPLIFTKKVNDKHKVIPLNKTVNVLGPNRHFPSSTKEWLNSIYTYNNNSLKNLSVADKNLTRIVQSYFDMYYGKILLKSKRIATRFRRLNLNKIFMGKPELKHTNNKVIITLFVYNEQKRLIDKQIRDFNLINFPSSNLPTSKVRDGVFLSINQRRYILNYLNENITGLDILNDRYESFNTTLKLEKEKFLTMSKKEITLYNKKLLLIESLELALDYTSDLIDACKNDETLHDELTKDTHIAIKDFYIGRDIRAITKLKMLLDLNRSKFENNSLSKLKYLVQEIYNKEVEFNVINLKNMYLDSNIFTQAMAIKLKNRDNRILRVLRTCINMVKLPRVNRVREKYGKPITNKIRVNKLINMFVNNNLNKYKNNQDLLNQMLLNVMPNYTNSDITPALPNPKLSTQVNNNKIFTKGLTIQGMVLNGLKDKTMAGVRLEARGRLTRRFTASRSLFKVKWKGTLQTINSSYKGLSSVILRGHVKPNVQYSLARNKTRNGAFGLRGWISSK